MYHLAIYKYTLRTAGEGILSPPRCHANNIPTNHHIADVYNKPAAYRDYDNRIKGSRGGHMMCVVVVTIHALYVSNVQGDY